MTRWGMVAITAAVAFALAVAADAQRILSGPTDWKYGFEVVGGAIGLFAISWVVAGTVYLISLCRASRGSLVGTSILISAIVAFLAYKGREANTGALQKTLRETAASMRASLPKRLDSNTTLVGVDSAGTTLTYNSRVTSSLSFF